MIDSPNPRIAHREFEQPEEFLGSLAPELASRIVASVADVALVLDRDGVVQDVSAGGESDLGDEVGGWLGKPWIETVTVESRPKIVEMLRDAAVVADRARWRQVNHPTPAKADLPIRYLAIEIDEASGRMVALGRDQRAIASLQQRLVDAQNAMEREYLRQREAETRYRLLFQTTTEAVVIVDAMSLKIVEVNPAAGQQFGQPADDLVGRVVADLFDANGRAGIQAQLAAVRAVGRAEQIEAGLVKGEGKLLLSASLFRQDRSAFFLIRLRPLDDAPAAAPAGTAQQLSRLIEEMPDGFVATGDDLKIMLANSAFLEMCQLASEEMALGKPITEFVGRPGVDMGLLMANLREHTSVRHFPTVVNGSYGMTQDVEVSAVSVPDGDQPYLGFAIRSVSPSQSAESRVDRDLRRSVEQLTELVGHTSLKNIVREATDLIERLCIEAALELTGDNRASAAEVLGLSRQSLYSKLRRYGLGNLGNTN